MPKPIRTSDPKVLVAALKQELHLLVTPDDMLARTRFERYAQSDNCTTAFLQEGVNVLRHEAVEHALQMLPPFTAEAFASDVQTAYARCSHEIQEIAMVEQASTISQEQYDFSQIASGIQSEAYEKVMEVLQPYVE